MFVSSNNLLNAVDFLTYSWTENEYKQTLEIEKKPNPLTPFPLSHQKFFVDRYHFDDMLSTINDDQFTDEFNQCLFAYENEKWFLCATGLGSCLEHIMLIIIENYDKNGFNILHKLGRSPTAKDYLKVFSSFPIKISSREQSFINMLFIARNSVAHYNTGKTQRKLCDILLDGISDIYNNYYHTSFIANP